MDFIGTSKTTVSLIAKARAFAANNFPILVIGEKGVGKSHFSRFTHLNSRRRFDPFIIFNAATSKDIEGELFGTSKSGLLGGENLNKGAIAKAENGTLLVQNIDAVPKEIQLQIAVMLQLGGYRPKGTTETFKSSCRFIFSLIAGEDKILPELLQLLTEKRIEILPLKKRQEDIEPLAKHFMEKWSRTLEKSAVKVLKKYSWPENVAELQKILLGAIIDFDADEICARHLQLKIDNNWHAHTETQLEEIALEDIVERKLRQFMQRLGKFDVENLHGAIIDRIERPLIKLVMERTAGNQLKAARILGINRNTLRTKLQKLEIL